MPQKWWVLASVGCGTFMATLDSSIVNIALATMKRQLDVSLTQVRWVILIYFLVITCLLLPFGRISDLYGRKKIFSLGFLIFTLGSLFCGLAPNLTFLVIARFVQAVGGAMIMANGPAIITSTFPSNERGGALGILAMVVSLGLISGPGIGGLLVGGWGWRSIFLINLPVGVLGLLIAIKFLAPDPKESRKGKPKFDWAGALLQSLTLFCFVELLEPPNMSILTSVSESFPRILLGTLGLLFLMTLIFVEQKAQAPVFDVSLFRDRVFWSSILSGFFIFVAYSSVAVLLPLFLEEVLQMPTHQTGIWLMTIPVIMLIVAPISGRLSDRIGSKELCLAGAFILSLTLLIMAGVFGLGFHQKVPQTGLFFALVAIGLAMGLFQSPNNNAIMGAVPMKKLGAASALIGSIRNLGAVTGAGLATGVFSWRFAESANFIDALHLTFMVSGLVALSGLVASLGKTQENS